MPESAKMRVENQKISFILPLTQPTGKIRVKERNSFCEYGVPVAVRQNPISMKHYVEWQIGYDLYLKDADLTTLKDFEFLNHKKERKLPYELSEIVFYSLKFGFLTKSEVEKVINEIKSTAETLDVIDEMQITRTNPIERNFNGVDFYKMTVSYPLVVHKFGDYDIYAEIINREKQRAVGIQPMLYVCLPMTSLTFAQQPFGRVLNAKECAEWKIGKNEAKLSLELFRIFGMLSENHKADTLAILAKILERING